MGLLDVQSVLARLYTDSAFRTAFFDDPSAARTGLTGDEQSLLAGIDRQQVERFARSLKQKRLGPVRELLPATATLLSDSFAGYFFDYCDRQPSAREKSDEATAFMDYLLSALPGITRELHLPGCWHDLLTCERLHVELLASPADTADPSPPAAPAVAPMGPLCAYPKRTGRVRIAAFQHDMEMLFPKAVGGELTDAQPAPCFVLIARTPAAARARLKRINAPSAQLLTLCDGTRKLSDILAEVAAGLRLTARERPAFTAECLRFLAPLAENGLIHWH
jgi:hypothetical protein